MILSADLLQVKVVEIDSLGRVLVPKDLVLLAIFQKKLFFFGCQHSGNLG
jgi:DNA-binding transcriptional regulator/RsmH inhibitor MraZ